VLAAALAAFIVASIPMVNLGFSVEKADMSSYSWLQGDFTMLILALPAVYLVSAVGEEVIYRGFLITRLLELGNSNRRSFSACTIVFSAVVFGLIHFGWGLMGIVQTTCMGLVLAAAYLLLQRNLWPLILAHGYMDTVLLVQIYLGPGQSAS
ncbi:MAG: CPBP family intramembrane glutamic endopeptidase, partial [Pseudomonadales bacterium]